MNKSRTLLLSALIALFSSTVQASASDLGQSYLTQLKRIRSISGSGDQELFLLMGNASDALEKEWSPSLAKELARVFNALLDVNQNYFLVELLLPMAKDRARQFDPILDSALSAKNKKLYKEFVKMDEGEEREGNG